jgi:hypothetical protein
MSAEGKKKRGESGKKNAEGIPFRKGGRHCDYSTARRNPQHPRGAGSLLVRAMAWGSLLPGFFVSDRLLKMTDTAMANCTHEALS